MLYLHGFDPRGPGPYHTLYAAEAARAAALTGRPIETGPRRRRDALAASWAVTAGTGRDRVETDYVFLRWDDLVRARWTRNEILLLDELVRWVVAWAKVGFFGRARRESRALWFAMLSTPVTAALFLLSAFVVVGAIGFVAGIAAHTYGWPSWTGAVPALLSLLLAPVLWRWLEGRLNVCWLSRCFTYMRRRARRRRDDLAERDRAFAGRILEAAADPAVDEVLVVGHSLGALHAISALARALEADAKLGADGRIALLTLGQPIAVHTAIGGDDDFLRDLRTLAAATQVPWVDVTSPSDPASGCSLDPFADIDANAGRLVQRSPRFHVCLTPERFRAIRRRPVDFHFQYLKSPDLAGGFDYFAMTAGPERLADQPWLRGGAR